MFHSVFLHVLRKFGKCNLHGLDLRKMKNEWMKFNKNNNWNILFLNVSFKQFEYFTGPYELWSCKVIYCIM